MKKVLFLILIAGANSIASAQWKDRRAALGQMHQVGEFRIFYTRSGKDALPNTIDSNRNSVPDYVEDIGKKLASARAMYNDHVRLMHPFNSPRYQGKVEYIDINLLEMPLKPGGPKHGIAYDGISNFDRPQDNGRKVKVLTIDISNDLPSTNPTPAHELFHLYQNGYTFFKNRWYTEGTARWAENITKSLPGKTRSLPQTSDEVNSLFLETYESGPIWNALAQKVDPENNGHVFIKAFLEELDRMDDVAAENRILDTLKWDEENQMSRSNNTYIWKAVINTLQRPEFLRQWDAEIQRLVNLKI